MKDLDRAYQRAAAAVSRYVSHEAGLAFLDSDNHLPWLDARCVYEKAGSTYECLWIRGLGQAFEYGL